MKKFIKKYISILFPDLLKFFRKQRVARKMISKPQILENGLKFYGIQEAKNYEPNIFGHIERLAKKYDNFVNIGANHGFYVFSLQHLFKKIIAVEALYDNVQIIGKNAFENNLQDKVFINQFAAFETTKVLKFYGAATGGSLLKGFNHQYDRGVYVQAISLDKLIPSDFEESGALYLIDVEGSEFSVLKGAEELIGLRNSTFIVEVSCREFMPNEIFSEYFMPLFKLFFTYGYQAQEIMHDGSLKSLTLEDVQFAISSNRYEGMMVIFEQI